VRSDGDLGEPVVVYIVREAAKAFYELAKRVEPARTFAAIDPRITRDWYSPKY